MHVSLKQTYLRLLSTVANKYHRPLYSSFPVNSRLVGLIGARGVGKTTLLLQLIKNKRIGHDKKIFYFSADHMYFNQTTLYEFIEECYLQENIQLFVIDEIHKYPNWSQEIKNIYDSFPLIQLIFSGSSSLELVKGGYDLSRRAVMCHLPGLSFREFLNIETDSDFPVISWESLFEEENFLQEKLHLHPGIKGHFTHYLQRGFYPFYYEDPDHYEEKILGVIDKTIFEDIANFYNLRTENLRILKKILIHLSTTPPGLLSVHSLAGNLRPLDDKTVLSYLTYLTETGLTTMLYPAEPGNVGLRRPDKIFLNNTNLHYALEKIAATSTDLGTLRELFFIQSIKNANLEIFHARQGDYQALGKIFEIGGKNKTKKQIRSLGNAWLVKDGILLASQQEIPLMYFGFLY